MLYLVSGELHSPGLLNLPHEEFVQLIRRVIGPSLELIVQHQEAGAIVAGGVPTGTQRVVMVADVKGDSHMAVRHLLAGLPVFSYYRWDVTPLESFREWLSSVKS